MTSSPEESLRFDLPYTASPAGLAQPTVGLHRMVGLAGAESSYRVEVTVLDVADHRLIRSGVQLAHRVIGGHGDWYLAAPDWQPLLPAERTEPLGRGDLPDELADLTLPFRRRGALGPVAAVSCDRQLFELRGQTGEQVLGRVWDDRVTIRRGGVTTARFREVTVEPGPAGLQERQRQWLAAALTAAGGTGVEAFPGLPDRIGTPATGLTDYPPPRPIDTDSTFENFIQALLATGLRRLISADLLGRSEDPAAGRGLREAADDLRAELSGLSAALGPSWVEQLAEELGWFATAVRSADGDGDKVRTLLRRERYLRLLDALVTAVRAPQLAENGALTAAETITGLLTDAVQKLQAAALDLRPGGVPQDWADAASAAAEVGRLARLGREVVPKRFRRTAKRLRPVTALLLTAREEGEQAAQARQQARLSAPADAFELGREYEQRLRSERDAQQAFVDAWPRVARRLERP